MSLNSNKDINDTVNLNEFVYGEVYDRSLEESKFAIIEYQDGEIIYEDYSKLDEYLENIFIPQRVYITKGNHEDTKQLTIRLADILRIGLSEIEIEHTINYLGSKDIVVGTHNTFIISEFANCNRSGKNKNHLRDLPRPIPKDELIEKFINYKKSGNQKLRNEIIEANMRLAKTIAYNIASYYTIPLEDAEGYAYEGLINAVEKYNPESGTMFSTYANRCIRNYIIEGASRINGFGNHNIFIDYFTNIHQAQVENNEYDIEQIESIYHIAECMAKKHPNSYKEYVQYVLLQNIISLDEYLDNIGDEECIFPILQDWYYDDEFETIYKNEIYNNLYSLLESLPPREKQIIMLHYGFTEDGRVWKLNKIGELVGVTREGIRKNKNKTLEKLKRRALSSKKITV